MLSNRGPILEESSILNFSLNILEAYERFEAMEEAGLMRLEFSPERVVQGMKG